MTEKKESAKNPMPKTIIRSDKRAKAIWMGTHRRAVKTYGEGKVAHQTAFAALKREYKKEGDKWVPRNKRKLSALQKKTRKKSA